MENGAFLTASNQAFSDYGLLMLLAIAVLGAVTAFLLYRQQVNRQQELQRELQALRFEIDDQGMQPQTQRREQTQENGQNLSVTPPPPRPLNRMQAELELQAYQKIWASVRDLHDKLGLFLRAIETGEPSADSRLAARNAALKAKDCAQRLRPFYPENIEALVFQLIDNEVHMHLSACAYLDNDEEAMERNSRDQASSAYQSLRDESKLIYDGECRQQLNILVNAIRSRLADQPIID